MKRGDLYRVYKASKHDPKKYRVFVVVSRQILINSQFSTVICAPIYSSFDGLSIQVPLGVEDGLKHSCSIHCDELISIPKRSLTNYITTLSYEKNIALKRALSAALELDA